MDAATLHDPPAILWEARKRKSRRGRTALTPLGQVRTRDCAASGLPASGRFAALIPPRPGVTDSTQTDRRKKAPRRQSRPGKPGSICPLYCGALGTRALRFLCLRKR